MITAPGFVAPGIWTEFRFASWGLLIALVVVVAAGALATVARPARAAALLFGAAAVVGLHALEFPMTSDRTSGRRRRLGHLVRHRRVRRVPRRGRCRARGPDSGAAGGVRAGGAHAGAEVRPTGRQARPPGVRDFTGRRASGVHARR